MAEFNGFLNEKVEKLEVEKMGRPDKPVEFDYENWSYDDARNIRKRVMAVLDKSEWLLKTAKRHAKQNIIDKASLEQIETAQELIEEVYVDVLIACDERLGT